MNAYGTDSREEQFERCQHSNRNHHFAASFNLKLKESPPKKIQMEGSDDGLVVPIRIGTMDVEQPSPSIPPFRSPVLPRVDQLIANENSIDFTKGITHYVKYATVQIAFLNDAEL
jgi:hypothetical protein